MARPFPLYMPLKPGYLHRFIRRTCLRSSPGSFRVVALDERLTLGLDAVAFGPRMRESAEPSDLVS
jgi:hypothetical protein